MSENQNTEWKESWRDEYLKWICGFANAQGGKIYIGKNDSGAVVGIPNSKKLLEDIPNKVRDILGILVDVNLLSEDGKEYLVRMYVHNNAAANLNKVAENVTAKFNLPTTTGKSIQVDGFLSASNATPRLCGEVSLFDQRMAAMW